MEKNIVDRMLECLGSYSFVSMDFLRNTMTDKDLQMVLKQIKAFAPKIKAEDIVVLWKEEETPPVPTIGAVFTKDYVYGKRFKAMSLFGIQNIQNKSYTKGAFKKTYYTDIVVEYKDHKVKFTLEGFASGHLATFLNDIYPYAKSGTTALSNNERKKMAMDYWRKNKESKFIEILEPISKVNGDAAVMMMNYYHDKMDNENYYAYKKIAKDLKAPQVFYLEGVLNEETNLHGAYQSYIKAFEYGITGHEDIILKFQRELRQNNITKRKPYKYNDLDMDVYMIDAIYSEPEYLNYLLFIQYHDVDSDLVNKWQIREVKDSEEEYLPTLEELEFCNLLEKEMYKWDGFDVHGSSREELDKNFVKELSKYVWRIDSTIYECLNSYDHIALTDIPRINFANYKLKERKINSILDMKAFLMETYYETSTDQFLIYEHPTARKIIEELKDFDDFKKTRLNRNKEASLRLLEEKISAYEEVMTTHKRTVNRMLALTYLWAYAKDTNIELFNLNKYVEKAKKYILMPDQELLEVRNAYLKQLNLTEKDLFKNGYHQQAQAIERFKFKAMQVGYKDKHRDVDLFEYPFIYPYAKQKNIDYHINTFLKKVCPHVKKEDILMYQGINTATYLGYIITKDGVYSNYLDQPIMFNELICLKVTKYDTIVAVYENHTEEIKHHAYKSDLEKMIHFINDVLVYL